MNTGLAGCIVAQLKVTRQRWDLKSKRYAHLPFGYMHAGPSRVVSKIVAVAS